MSVNGKGKSVLLLVFFSAEKIADFFKKAD